MDVPGADDKRSVPAFPNGDESQQQLCCSN